MGFGWTLRSAVRRLRFVPPKPLRAQPPRAIRRRLGEPIARTGEELGEILRLAVKLLGTLGEGLEELAGHPLGRDRPIRVRSARKPRLC